MTQTYQVHGASCGGCLKKISNIITGLPEVNGIPNIDLDSITIEFKPSVTQIDIDYLNQAFGKSSYYLTKQSQDVNFELVDAAVSVTS
jgi:copper chaperone CopZ